MDRIAASLLFDFCGRNLQEDLPVALGASDTAVYATLFTAPENFGRAGHTARCSLAKRIIAHDAALSDLFAPDFELRFHQQDPFGKGCAGMDRGHEKFEGDERDIDDDESEVVVEIGGLQIPGVDPLPDLDAGIETQARMHLTMANIDRHDPCCAPLQETICKATGRSADVETDQPSWVEFEISERSVEFLTAPGDEAAGTTLQTNDSIGADSFPGFVDALVVDEYASGDDQRLGRRSARCQAISQDPFIETLALQSEAPSTPSPGATS